VGDGLSDERVGPCHSAVILSFMLLPSQRRASVARVLGEKLG